MASTSTTLPGLRPQRRIVKADATTDDAFGQRPQTRTAQERLQRGVVNLDKPSGPTSHQVASWVSKIVNIEPVGHGGTLDPRVTGVLPVAIGPATKGIVSLLTAGKEYLTLMRLHEERPEAKIRDAIDSFVGDVKQLPPVRSAVARRVRQRRIYYVTVHEVVGRDVLFTVGCEAGTYVRNLCRDIAKRLGTRGHMQQLRRTRTGPFSLEEAVTLQDLHDAVVEFREHGDEQGVLECAQPLESLFVGMPKLVVRDSAIGAVCHGAPLALPGVVQLDDGVREGQYVVIESLKGEAVALARAAMNARDIQSKSTGVAARPERILMPKSTYPKVWKRE